MSKISSILFYGFDFFFSFFIFAIFMNFNPWDRCSRFRHIEHFDVNCVKTDIYKRILLIQSSDSHASKLHVV